MIEELQRELEFLGLCVEQDLDKNERIQIIAYDEDYDEIVFILDADSNLYDCDNNLIAKEATLVHIVHFLLGRLY